MGVAVADYDEDGHFDIVKTNFSDDVPNVYWNRGDGTFEDRVFESGLGAYMAYVGWGVHLVDVDHDGRRDLLMLNGHVYPEAGQIPEVDYRQPRLLYWNVGGGRFKDVSGGAGAGITRALVVARFGRRRPGRRRHARDRDQQPGGPPEPAEELRSSEELAARAVRGRQGQPRRGGSAGLRLRRRSPAVGRGPERDELRVAERPAPALRPGRRRALLPDRGANGPAAGGSPSRAGRLTGLSCSNRARAHPWRAVRGRSPRRAPCAWCWPPRRRPQAQGMATSDRVQAPGFWPTKGAPPREEYLGAEACTRCHAGHARAGATSMARTAVRAADSGVLRGHESCVRLSGYDYEIRRATRQSVYGNEGRRAPRPSSRLGVRRGQGRPDLRLRARGRFHESRVSYLHSLASLGFTPARALAAPRDLEEAGPAGGRAEARRCFGCHMTATRPWRSSTRPPHPRRHVRGLPRARSQARGGGRDR